MQKPKMLIGQSGVKYGLQTRQPKPQSQPAGKLAAFGADSDSDEETVGAQVARQAARKVADSKVQEMYAAALAEDPNAFNYDEVYDSIQQQKAAPKQQERLDRKPKYIASLLEQAQVRKREEDISYERRLLKERQKEDHMYDNEEKFITSAYRKKLEEDKKWIESQKLKDMEDEQNDVTKLGHMNNFFTNLTKNVALGGSTAAPKQQQQHQQQQPSSPQQPSDREQPGQQQQQHRQHSSLDADQEQQQPPVQQLQRHRSSDVANGDVQQPGKHQQALHHGEAAEEPTQQGMQQQHQQQPDKAAAVAHRDASGDAAAAAEQQQLVGGKRKNDDASVTAARERYLARKRQQAGQ